MRHICFFAIVFLFSFSATGFWQHQDSKFYYAYSKRIPLTEAEGKVVIRYRQPLPKPSYTDSIESSFAGSTVIWYDNRTVGIAYHGIAPVSSKTILESASKDVRVSSFQPLYSIESGSYLAITDEILVRFLDKISTPRINAYNRQQNVTIVDSSRLTFRLRVPAKADALQIANMYQESGLVEFAHPNFITQVVAFDKVVVPQDEYFNKQFSLLNTGQIINDGHSGTAGADIDATLAWGITRGISNIIIAVIDQGVTDNHPDLPSSRQVRLKGSNFADGDPDDPSPTNDNNHGNACAGLIAASHNTEGIAGVAPNCRIMPIRIFNTDQSDIPINKVADAIDFAWEHGADVISCSWGYRFTDPQTFPIIVQAIKNATINGRNGRGCVVVFATGNSANHKNAENGAIVFPANVTVDGVLTVGASDRNDNQANYSPSGNPGSNKNQQIDVVAPSHRAYPDQIDSEGFDVWTIDIPNVGGDNPCKSNATPPPVLNERLPEGGNNFLSYTGRFGGTSAACPLVAGVAALILSRKPSLSQIQVFNIITAKAEKVGGYNYINGISNELGHGRLNALFCLQSIP